MVVKADDRCVLAGVSCGKQVGVLWVTTGGQGLWAVWAIMRVILTGVLALESSE